jgi:hypothetical protein
MNIGSEKPVNSFPFRGAVLEDIQKMAVTVHSIVSAIQNMTDCNTVCSMLRRLQPMELSPYQGNLLIEAVKKTRYDLLTAMVREFNFSVDSVDFFKRCTALSVSALEKNRQMSKFLIQELKADVNKTWFSYSSRTCSVLTILVERRYLNELKFFLVLVL